MSDNKSDNKSDKKKYFLPPEWSQQSGAMLTWPHEKSDWKPILKTVEPVFIEIARHISLREKLLIVCFDHDHMEHINALLKKARLETSKIISVISQSNDSWARDHAPICVYQDNAPLLLDFEFNGWGEKYEHKLDNKITENLYKAGTFGDIHYKKIDLILEGGSIDVNGAGEMLTTTRCLLSKHRNPKLTQLEIDEKLCALFDLNKIFWLEHGYLMGDDTDAHIDTLVRFCSENTIVYNACNDKEDGHYEELKLMENELKTIIQNYHKHFLLVALPLPNAIYNDKGERLPATYANFFIVNNTVLVPLYQDPADSIALNILQECFPEKEIIGINCVPLIQQFGSLHCVTMQFPEGILN